MRRYSKLIGGVVGWLAALAVNSWGLPAVISDPESVATMTDVVTLVLTSVGVWGAPPNDE